MFPDILRRESRKANKAHGKGQETDFNADKPWEYLFFLATTNESEGASEHMWWATNFKDQASLVLHGVRPLNHFVAGAPR